MPLLDLIFPRLGADLKLVATHLRSTVLTTSGAPGNVSVYAGRDDGACTTSVLVVNKTPIDIDMTVTITGLPMVTPASSFSVTPLSIVVADIAETTGATTLATYP